MAKLSAHGSEIGRVYFTTSAKAYMADGAILKNSGFGWKLAGKVKAGISPLEAYEAQKQKQVEYLVTYPALAAYRKELHSLAGLGKAWKLDAAISMMPDDCDGVWSECCDGYGDNVHADINEIAELCRLYRAAQNEGKANSN